MSSERRERIGSVLMAAGMLLLMAASAAEAQTHAAAGTVAVLTWSQWLQNAVNVMKLLELGTFGFGAYQFWIGRRERRSADAAAVERAAIDAKYQAWQVINSAQGKGGSGGRLEALRDLLANGVSLAGINLDDAWLESVQLPSAILSKGSLQRTNLSHANLRGANLAGADLRGADLVGADLSGATLKGANIAGARLSAALLDGADLNGLVGWQEIRSISHASIEGIRHAPAGFTAFALAGGAVTAEALADEDPAELLFSRHFRTI